MIRKNKTVNKVKINNMVKFKIFFVFLIKNKERETKKKIAKN